MRAGDLFKLVSCLGLFCMYAGTASAQNWKPALGDADEFYDAAEDLHDRAEKFRDVRVMPVTAQLEYLSTDLYQLLKKRACASDVVTTLNAAAATLEQAEMLVSLSCQLREDRKAISELAKARRYFDLTARHIALSLDQASGAGYRAPSQYVPAPSWYQAPVAPVAPIAPIPYGVEVQYQQTPAAPRPLARVLVTGVR